jgi:hypothetical protein
VEAALDLGAQIIAVNLNQKCAMDSGGRSPTKRLTKQGVMVDNKPL